MKVTKKYLTDWINKQLPDINVHVKLVDIKFINRNANPVMEFIYKIIFMLETDNKHPIYVYSYFTMKEIQDHLDSGNYELYWKWRGSGKWIQDSEIDLRKIITKTK